MAARSRPIDEVTTAAYVAALDDPGFVLIRGVLDARAVDELRAAFPAATPGSTLHVDLDERTVFAERWRGLPHIPAVAALVGAVLGPSDHEVRIHGRDPGAGAGGQGLHADLPPGQAGDVHALTLLWLLDTSTIGNGATRVVPHSHRGAAAVPRHLAQPGTVHPDEVVVEGAPGDVLVFDAQLWHSGRRNDDGTRRRVVQMTVTR